MTYITVTGKFLKGDADGTPEVGSVIFRRSVQLTSSSQNVSSSPGDIEAPLDASGAFSIPIPATNDPDYSPIFTYEVIRQLSGGVMPSYFISVPANTVGGTVDLADIAPVVENASGVSYVLASTLGQPNGVATLDVDGLLTLSQRAGGSGGTGGTPATTVVDEKTFGQASAVGTSTLFARGDHTHGTPPAQTLASLGAEASGTASSLVNAHVAAADPHGDRNYSNSQLTAGLTTKSDVGHTHGGASTQVFEWYVDTAVQGEGVLKKRNNTTGNLTIVAVRVEACIAGPQGGPIVADVNINGTTIFTTQGNRPTIPDGSTDSGKVTSMNVTTLTPGQALTVDLDFVGTNVPGSGILVTVVVA